MSEPGGWSIGERTDGPVRVLCVADDGTAARVESRLREVLDDRDLELAFATARSVADALAVIETDPVDCVATRHDLPEDTGVDLAAALQEHTPALPVVLFTDGGSDDLAVAAARAGVTDYLPVAPGGADGLLARRVAALAADARARREARAEDGDEDADARDGSARSVERQLRALQRTARDLNVAESVDEIGEIAVAAAADILDLEITGIWRYDRREDALLPITMTAAGESVVGSQPTFGRGEGLVWQAFEAGETEVYDDLSAVEERYNPDTPIGSEIIVPLGEEGVIVTGSTSPQEFSDRDVDLFRTLGASVEAALIRAQREAELRRQNERLDRFASVVSHDLRNPLSVAEGYLDFARESGDPADFDRVADAHDRIGRLIEDLLALARGEPVENPTDLDLEAVAREAWAHVDTDPATLTIENDLSTIRGERGRLIQLFENCFRNAVEHSDGGVAIRVGPLPRGGFYVADDGPGIPPDRREEVFDHGVSYGDGGTGFGLSIVADIVRAHGWRVSVTESDGGGARFEFETNPGTGTDEA